MRGMELLKLSRDEFISDMGLFSLSDEFKDKFYQYVEYHKEFLGESDVYYEHYLLLALTPEQRLALGFSYFHIDSRTKHCELFAVYVEHEYRSKGIASTLLSEALTIAAQQQACSIRAGFTGKGIAKGKLVQSFLCRAEHFRPRIQFEIIADNKHMLNDR